MVDCSEPANKVRGERDCWGTPGGVGLEQQELLLERVDKCLRGGYQKLVGS